MKILYIANNTTNDFLSDALFHGLSCMNNIELVDANELWYMYDDINKHELTNRFHGRGFTYYASLPKKQIDRTSIEKKIEDMYFDLIIYGNINRCRDFEKTVFDKYPSDKIVILDGEDSSDVNENYIMSGVFFKREFTNELKSKYPFINPIHFAYPHDKMPLGSVDKNKLVAQIIPGVMETFTFNNEEDYFMDYRESMFGFTWKKSGWDCLRHYEILCNGCMPLFLDIEKCPDNICTTIPKSILIRYYKESGLYDLFDMGGEIKYDDRNTMIVNRDLTLINNFILTEDNYGHYADYVNTLMVYCKNNLTTIKLAEYVLSNVQ